MLYFTRFIGLFGQYLLRILWAFQYLVMNYSFNNIVDIYTNIIKICLCEILSYFNLTFVKEIQNCVTPRHKKIKYRLKSVMFARIVQTKCMCNRFAF